MKYPVQVNKDHYNFLDYVHPQRWGGYLHQIKLVIKNSNGTENKPFEVLEIGVGDKTVSTILTLNGIKVTTVDLDKSLKPNFVDSLPELKSQIKKRYDCILCCEVLEHLRFEDVEKSFRNFAKIANLLVISVPCSGAYMSVAVQVWYLKKVALNLFAPSPKTLREFKFNGEHYWELGAKNYSLNRFLNTAKNAGFEVTENYRVPEYLYHHIFSFKKI